MRNPPMLLDLIDKDKLDQIMRSVTKATGVASIITETDGRPISSPYNFTRFCEKYCRSTEEGRKRCYESDMFGGRESARTKKCHIYKCLNSGLIDGAAPIVVEGHHLANVLFGQVLDFPPEREESIERARAIGIRDFDGYLMALERVPLMSLERINDVGSLMEVVTKTISEMAYQKYQLIRHSRRNLSSIVNSVSDCILSMEDDMTLIMANKAGVLFFGMENDDLAGRKFSDLLADEASMRTCYRHISGDLKRGVRMEINATAADGRVVPMQMSLSGFGMPDEDKNGYVAVLRDITEEKRLQQIREDLAGMLSHDLGNPVLSIQKAMSLLADGGLGPLNDAQQEIAGLALLTSRQLYGMVTDFLDIYRHENRRLFLHKTIFDIVQLIRESVEQIRLSAQDKRIRVHFNSSVAHLIVYADYNRLMRVCVNLLENGLFFSPEGRDMQVTVSVMDRTRLARLYPDTGDNESDDKSGCTSQRARRWLLIEFEDQGLGIPEEKQKFIFDKFYSSKHRNVMAKGRKGVGLGLTFCKMTVASHKGVIWVKSPLFESRVMKRRGCRFSIALPIPEGSC